MKPRTFKKLTEYVNGRRFQYKLHNGWAGKLIDKDARYNPISAILYVIRIGYNNGETFGTLKRWVDDIISNDVPYDNRIKNAFNRMPNNVIDVYDELTHNLLINILKG